MITDLAKKLLSENTVRLELTDETNNNKVVYTSPSSNTYIQQWFWDSCLHSLVWLKIGKCKRATQEIESLELGKGEKEFFPHMIFWRKKRDVYWFLFDSLYPTGRHSELIQPPIIGYTLLEMVKNNCSISHKIIENVFFHYKYIMDVRDPEKSGLITIVHPWESGLDSSPKFDLELQDKKFMRVMQWRRMRRLLREFANYNWNQEIMARKSSFRVKCVLTNTLLIWGIEAFIEVLRKKSWTKETVFLEEKKETLTQSLFENCWNEKHGLFFDVNLNKKENSQIQTSTISSLFPLLLDLPTDMKDRLVEHLMDRNEYWTKYPIPSVSLAEKSFNLKDSHLLWRGPTWINTNFFLLLGLIRNKEQRIADSIAKKTIELVKNEGFREFYNPLTGKGQGARNFSWSTLVLLMLQEKPRK
ncbi:MAG: MGH1-like glycoside hydrolase domain-containing protein [Candidatus Heimdallarchaeaceae archaeon]